MKNLFQLTAILLVSPILFTSCKKVDEGNRKFDVNNPAGYVVAGTFRHSF